MRKFSLLRKNTTQVAQEILDGHRLLDAKSRGMIEHLPSLTGARRAAAPQTLSQERQNQGVEGYPLRPRQPDHQNANRHLKSHGTEDAEPPHRS